MFRSGFTLLEMLLVVVMLTIITAVAFPSFDAMYADLRVKGGADSIRGAWADARAHAIDDGTPYRFAVKPEEGSYRVAPSTASFWSDATETGQDGVGIEINGQLPANIRFQLTGDLASSADGQGWVRLVTFQPDGTCKEDASIEIAADGCRPITLQVRGLTGFVSSSTGAAK